MLPLMIGLGGKGKGARYSAYRQLLLTAGAARSAKFTRHEDLQLAVKHLDLNRSAVMSAVKAKGRNFVEQAAYRCIIQSFYEADDSESAGQEGVSLLYSCCYDKSLILFYF